MTESDLDMKREPEIDLRQLVGALRRHWKIISQFTGATLLLSIIYAFTQPRVWKGEFQIVLASNKPPTSNTQSLLQSNPDLASIVGAGISELETEVKILESPSVLMPVFEFAKNKAAASGSNIDSWRFQNWVKKVAIKLEKGTSVLNISYQDNDKTIILPVIKRISQQYQSYSRRDREQGIAQAVKYLSEQVSLYRVKSANSIRTAQQFAMEHDLTSLKGDGNENEIRNSLNIEESRIQAANDIRNINEQLEQLDSIGSDPEALMYMGSNIPELASKGLPKVLDEIDTELALRESKFTSKDETIRRLKERRKVLIDTLRRQTYGYLIAKRVSAEARLAAAERPKGVLIKYRELMRKSNRDEETLNRLEEDLQVLSLEQARKEDPWDLISKPRMLDSPIAPKKSRILAFGLLAGLVGGSAAALALDRRSGRIFTEEELQQLIPCRILAHLEHAGMQGKLALLSQGELSGSHRIGLIPVGVLPKSLLVNQVLNQLKELLPHTEITCSRDLVEAAGCDHQLLITSLGYPTRAELSNLRQQLELQRRPISGWLLFEDQNRAS